MIRKYIIVADDSIKGFDEEIENLERKWGAEEIEPCGDCISRQAALKQSRVEYNDDGEGYGVIYIEDIEDLPSVTPQPKTGRWLDKEVNSDKVIDEWQSARCNVCDKYHTTPYMYYFSKYNYCPNCGAKMEGKE